MSVTCHSFNLNVYTFIIVNNISSMQYIVIIGGIIRSSSSSSSSSNNKVGAHVKRDAGANPMRSLASTTHQNANKLTQANLGSSTSTQPPQSQTKSIKTAGKSNSESYKR
jgi:hypothetical protein